MVLAARSRLVLLAGLFMRASEGLFLAEAVDEESVVALVRSSEGLLRHGPEQPLFSLDRQLLPARRLGTAWPLTYVHVPKTGSSILNAFLRLPGVCPDLAAALGDSSYADRFPGCDTLATADSLCPRDTFRNASLCPGLVAPPSTSSGDDERVVGFHMPLGNRTHFEQYYAGHALTILRQPEQRVISGLLHVARTTGREVESLQFSEGCMVRMFVGEGETFDQTSPSDNWYACFALSPGDPPLPKVSAEDIVTAVRRLRRFAFVGIQEEWHLSVCLLHAMFGGECSAAEFMNTRPSDASRDVFAAPEPYNTSILGGWLDVADRAVYDVGLKMFHALCDAHNVTMESCQPCFQAAGLV